MEPPSADRGEDGPQGLRGTEASATLKRRKSASKPYDANEMRNPMESETSYHMEGLCKICKRNVEHGMIQNNGPKAKILQGVECFYSTEYLMM